MNNNLIGKSYHCRKTYLHPLAGLVRTKKGSKIWKKYLHNTLVTIVDNPVMIIGRRNEPQWFVNVTDASGQIFRVFFNPKNLADENA